MSFFGDIFSKISMALQSQVSVLTNFFVQLRNIGTQATQFIQQKIQKFIQNLTKDPKSKEDYWRFFGIYFSKKFTIIATAVLAVIGYILIFVVYPWADGRLWTANIRLDAPKYSKFTGKARVYDTMNSLIYEGALQNGKPHGNGTQYDSLGNLVYKGEFEHGSYCGNGELYSESGVVIYSGLFSNNNYEGEGKLFNDIGKVVYAGNFSVGQRSGTGIEYDPATGLKKYYGEYSADVRSGSGVEYESDGTSVKYEGGFENGVYGGEGKLYSGGNLLYSGEFSNGIYEGAGNLFDLDTGLLYYSGNFKNGLYDGNGKLYDLTTSAVVYDGDFASGKKQGTGKSYDKLGSQRFDGAFRSDSIDYIAYLGTSPEDVSKEFGKETYRTEKDGRLIITYLSLDASLVFTVDTEKGEYVCEKIILGTKESFMGIGARSTAVERRNIMGDPFSSIDYNCPSYYKIVLSNLAVNVNNIKRVPSDKYTMDNYFIRFYFNDGRTELKFIEICSN